MGRDPDDWISAGGRGHGRGRQQSNRYRGKSKGIRSSYKPKELEMKFGPQGQRYHMYATIKEHLCKFAQKTYDDGGDVATSLKKEVLVDLKQFKPLWEMAMETNATIKLDMQYGMDMEYRLALNNYNKRVNNRQKRMEKAYADIRATYCTKVTRGRIDTHPDFDTKIYNNPIELLVVIKVLMYDTICAQNPMVVMTETIGRLINIKQQEDSLLDYVKRFKQQCDILVSQLGKRFLDIFVEQLEEYCEETDAAKKEALKKGAFDRWLAYLIMKGADWTKLVLWFNPQADGDPIFTG
jgi:hypothetical protein